ncbi:TIGR02234 family membrane protein [Nocardioides salsibiostraticola]
MTGDTSRRRTFGPVILLGLASSGLLAMAGNQPWADVGSVDPTTEATLAVTASGSGEVPLALALGLVVLATWGVVLVTRRTTRRLVAGLGLIASLGAVATVVIGRGQVSTDLRAALTEAGASDSATVNFTVWFWIAGVAAVVCVIATLGALRNVAAWPEMSSRYDAPTSAPLPTTDPATGAGVDTEQQNLDLWKSIDEGRDPTA